MVQRVSFAAAECPVARSVDQIGDWWKLLILRDAFDGFTRFDEFEKSLGIAPNMLTRRLGALVDAGLLERRPYAERPVRHEYVLTQRGREFRPVLVTLLAWGNAALDPGQRSIVLTDRATGDEVVPLVVDRATGRPLDELRVVAGPGPAASRQMLDRFEAAHTARAERRSRVR